MKIQPINVILTGLLLCSIGINILYHESNRKLIYRLQKLEAGPARGLFHRPEINYQQFNDQELNDLINRMLLEKKMDKWCNHKGGITVSIG